MLHFFGVWTIHAASSWFNAVWVKVAIIVVSAYERKQSFHGTKSKIDQRILLRSLLNKTTRENRKRKKLDKSFKSPQASLFLSALFCSIKFWSYPSGKRFWIHYSKWSRQKRSWKMEKFWFWSILLYVSRIHNSIFLSIVSTT